MTVKELQKTLQQALNYFTKYKPSDLVICDVEEEYNHNWLNAPYMTVTNGDFDKCGISLSNKSKDGANKIVTSDDYEETLEEGDEDNPDKTFEIRNIKRILTDAVRTLKDMDPEELLLGQGNSEGLEKPFVCVTNDDGRHFFVSLNHLETGHEEPIYEPLEETKDNDMYINHKFNESKKITFGELKKIVCESYKLESAKKGLLEWTEIFIEDCYKNDVEDFSIESIQAMAEGKKLPDYNSIVNVLFMDYESYMNEETISLLEAYKNGKFIDLVKTIILAAIKNVASELSNY